MADTEKTFTQLFNKLKADKKSLFAVILGLSGIFLILLSELPLVSATEKYQADESQSYSEGELCNEVEKLLTQIEGAGKVSVMLTFETKGEKIFARDSDEEVSLQGENRTNQTYIIIDGNQGEEGLVIKEIYPEVRGIAVVCDGGDDPEVKSEISAMLSALFDIGSNRISIAPRAEKE